MFSRQLHSVFPASSRDFRTYECCKSSPSNVPVGSFQCVARNFTATVSKRRVKFYFRYKKQVCKFVNKYIWQFVKFVYKAIYIMMSYLKIKSTMFVFQLV